MTALELMDASLDLCEPDWRPIARPDMAQLAALWVWRPDDPGDPRAVFDLVYSYLARGTTGHAELDAQFGVCRPPDARTWAWALLSRWVQLGRIDEVLDAPAAQWGGLTIVEAVQEWTIFVVRPVVERAFNFEGGQA